MGTTLRRTALLLALAAGLLAPDLARAAFECPVKPPPATKPLPGDLGRILKPYDDPRADPALKSDIATMKSEAMPSGEIVDHLVAAYCPTVNGIPKLSDADKDGVVRRFASELAQVVYSTGTGTVDAIILDVPVPPDLYAKVKEVAEQRKETQDAFVLGALRKAAGMP